VVLVSPSDRRVADVIKKETGRLTLQRWLLTRIAVNIVKLPELCRKQRAAVTGTTEGR
jgi:hypothetical protein